MYYKRFHRLAEAAAFLGVLFTLAGLLGRHAWFLELFTHFQPQLALCFLFYACLEIAARRHGLAVASVAFAAVNALPALLLLLPPSAGLAQHEAAARLRILQANILTSNTNSPALLALVASEQPDVAVLQEADERWLRELAPLTNSHPPRQLPRDDNFGAAIYCKTNALPPTSSICAIRKACPHRSRASPPPPAAERSP